MFQQYYLITDLLLANIKRINGLIYELNNNRFPNLVLLELERSAREVSTYASTSIEGNPLPLTEVKKILKTTPAHIRTSEREILNYNHSLLYLDEKIKTDQVRLSLGLILEVQKQVTNGLLSKNQSGKLRQIPVVVNDPRIRKTVYLPPDIQDVKYLIEDLVEFVNCNQGEIDPLILAGIFHKQMVLIHPFTDGNGRTTRLMTKILLAQMGLNTFNLFSFENYYNQNVTKYFQTVGEFGNYYDLVNRINFTPWLEYFTEGIIDELLRVQKLLPEVGVNPETTLEKHHLKMFAYIKEKNFITDRDYAKLVDRAKATRTLDFQKLLDLKLIERKGKGKATYYVLKEIN